VTASPAKAGRPLFDIGDIVRRHRAELEEKHRLDPAQKRVLTDLAQCRTAALGGHLDVCVPCGYEQPSYNSCRNRHCPKCQASTQQAWIEARRERQLVMPHYHVVFTLPAELRLLAQQVPRVVYDALFHAAARTLLEFGQSRLGVALGATLVLHTWTRDLHFHPHVHAIVTGGGLASDAQQVKRDCRGHLLPVKAMARVLRGKVLAELGDAYAAGAFAHVEALRDPLAFPHLVAKVAKLSWNVYAKLPLGDGHHVLDYLGRYTHRVGIANSRLLEVTPERVVFRTKGDATETLHPVEFLWRLVHHVLPDGFHKIRHVGLYASACRDKLAAARALLQTPPPARRAPPTWQEGLLELTGRDARLCPRCLAPLELRPLPPTARAPPLPKAA
jgi:hypothetical protein